MPFEATIAMVVKDSLVAVHVKHAGNLIQTLLRSWTVHGKVRELFTADDKSSPRCINRLGRNKSLTSFVEHHPTIYRNTEDFVSGTSDRLQLLWTGGRWKMFIPEDGFQIILSDQDNEWYEWARYYRRYGAPDSAQGGRKKGHRFIVLDGEHYRIVPIPRKPRVEQD